MVKGTLPGSGPRMSAEHVETKLPSAWDVLYKILRPIASLKITVILLSMAIFLVLMGTLAQKDNDIWVVVHQYFRTFVAWIDFEAVFAFSSGTGKVPGGFPFPGGWLLGSLMTVNLLAAHAIRFKVQARGTRLWSGLGVIAIGLAATWLVIASGSNDQGFQVAGDGRLWTMLWILIKASLAMLWLLIGYTLVVRKRSRNVEWWSLIVADVLLGGLLVWLFVWGEDATLNASSMRILWQLIKAEMATGVLLAGCVMIFKRRCGVVLLHAGVLLIMANEVLVGVSAEEGQMVIQEGHTRNYVRDIRSVELAVIDRSHPGYDEVTAIPKSRLVSGQVSGQVIRDKQLPFDIKVNRFLQNSAIRPADEGDENLATAGVGLRQIAVERDAGVGTDTGGKVDMSAVYITLIDKESSQPIATHLVSLVAGFNGIAETVTVAEAAKDGPGEKTYEIFLRFRRTYKPYSMMLEDFRFDRYIGTEMAKNYSSQLRLVDKQRNVDREVRIWMNNPLRYAGETFYQSEFTRDRQGRENGTILQVVTNVGWMMPYVGCMIVATGMLAQFSIALLRFLRRGAATDKTSSTTDSREKALSAASGRKRASAGKRSRRQELAQPPSPAEHKTAAWLVPAFVVGLAVLMMAYLAVPPRYDANEMNLYEFSRLPLVKDGRGKPFDTLARNSLRIISEIETFKDGSGKRQSAIRWLLDVICKPENAEYHKIFRIRDPGVRDVLGLERRKGERYSLFEIAQHAESFDKQVNLAGGIDARRRSRFQMKMIELANHVQRYRSLGRSFARPPADQVPTDEEVARDTGKADQRARLRNLIQRIKRTGPPLAVPIRAAVAKGPAPAEVSSEESAARWTTLISAWVSYHETANRTDAKRNRAAFLLGTILNAYHDGDVKKFNTQVQNYTRWLAENRPADVDTTKINFETFLNNFAPFFYGAWGYLLAFVLAACSWLGFTVPLRRSSFWLILVIFILHSAALLTRMYICGRPPVTNLYSSAVFIGWACAAGFLVLELLFPIGVGNALGALSGFAALWIAHNLAADGDTFVVLQAVLDTQFWLATHVVCITLGYAATFIAGLLGIAYILMSWAPVLNPFAMPNRDALADVSSQKKSVARMIYGVVCFAMWFSFVGTVLGGLWADDSWGRFWGWDPKENGALMIVLWNAIVLHARWGGLVRDRGLAILAVGGNVVTGWSWFGVNELGAGLHSYGFTEGVVFWLVVFWLSQAVVIGIGLLPSRPTESRRGR